MRVALAQINSHMGNFSSNAEKILHYANRAFIGNCDIVVFPELSLFGYWPADLLERPSIIAEQNSELEKLIKKLPKQIRVIFGCVSIAKAKERKFYKNTAIMIYQSKIRRFYKELLPTYDVFDEDRHFAKGDLDHNVFTVKGEKVLVTICEDIWGWGEAWEGTRYAENPFKDLRTKGISLTLNLSASPYSKGKKQRRKSVVEKTGKYLRSNIVYVNCVGAQDEIVFDGGSLALNTKGDLLVEGKYFEEDFQVVDYSETKAKIIESKARLQEIEFLRKAIALGIKDFCHKNSIQKVHLGLSGGIDSAVVACLAVDALGAENVTGIALPTDFNAPESETLAKKLAENLGISYFVLPIQTIYQEQLKSFENLFGKEEFSTTNENLQARIRGNLLMAFSNRYGSMLLATGNKSEFATGYSTLYGDMCGGLAPIGDLLKMEVFELAKYYNHKKELIPKRIIERPPSAELRPNQKDQDSLPPYSSLDRAVQSLVVERNKAKTPLEHRVLDMLFKSEFKRWQAPPILRLSQHSFGTGRRYPITHRAYF